MLLHIPIFILIIGLVIGIIAITQSIQIYLTFRKQSTIIYSIFIICLNLSLTIRLSQYYFAENILVPIDRNNSVIVFSSIIIVEILLLFLFYLQLIYLFRYIWRSTELNLNLKSFYPFLISMIMLIPILIFKDFFILHIRFILRYIPFLYLIGTLLFFLLGFKIKRIKLKTDSVSNSNQGVYFYVFLPMLIQFSALIIIRVILIFKFIHGKQFFYLLLPIYYLSANIFAIFYILRILKKNLLKEKEFSKIDKMLTDFFLTYRISKREQEVVQLLYNGKNNREIADTLFVSLQTIKFHIANIYKKTSVKNRGQLFNLIVEKKT